MPVCSSAPTSVGATAGTMGGIPASLGQPGHPYRSPLIQEPPRMDRLTSCRTFIARRRAGLLVPVLAVLIGGCTAAGTPSGAAQATSPATVAVGAPVVGAPAASLIGPAVAPVPNGLATSGAGSSSGTSAAIAYPYPGVGASAGLAPDHELVVSGAGWANVKGDLSDRSTAQRSALAAALADAKAQAQAAAADAGVTLGGVISLSVSVGGNYVMPMGVLEAPTAPSTGGGTVVPPAAGGSAPNVPTTEQLEVTVTVAYSIS